MSRRRAAIAVVALLPVLAACGGDDDDAAPNPTSVPPSESTGLPPAFTECVAERGYEVSSPDEIHTLPQAVLQACFGRLHG